MKDDPEENAALLKELHKHDANKHCADCGQLAIAEEGTRWASWNIGVFLCIRCGGLHRTLGTHISKIKSLTLDKWTDEQVQSMQSKGNAKANSEYNPHPDRFPFPSFPGDQQQYIRDKYERKLFSGTSNSTTAMKQQPIPSLGAQKTYPNEIRALREMGFMDAQACLAALKQCNGNVNAAVDILFAGEKRHQPHPPPPPPGAPPSQPPIVLEDDPWANLNPVRGAEMSTSRNEDAPATPPPLPHFLDDPFADWK